MRKILITGIAGGQGRLLAHRLSSSWQVCGIDRLPWPGAPRNITVHMLDIRKKRFEDIVRRERPEAVVHLAFVRHFRTNPRVRHEVNVEGTRRLLEASASVGIKRLVVLSSANVYGALPENPRYVEEDHPLNSSRTFPDIRDMAEVEGLVATFLWQYPEISTSILRAVNTMGPNIRGVVGTYLGFDFVPSVTGFNPMLQFIHEQDLTEALVLAVESELRGTFNVAGPGAVPLKTAIHAAGRRRLSVPEPLAHLIISQLFRLRIYRFPPAAIDFLKYPCTVSGRKFERATGFKPAISLEDTLASVDR